MYIISLEKIEKIKALSSLLCSVGISDIMCATLSDDTFKQCKGDTNIELECNRTSDQVKMLFVEASHSSHCD